MAHFGKPAQPYSKDALEFLKDYVLGRRLRVRLWRKDQYGRVVGTAQVRKGLFRRDVSLAMLKAGMATVYEAKFGSEFGGREQMYREAEEKAKKNRVGMWKEERSVWERLRGKKQEDKESPREFKTRMKQLK
jgi:endonuclease YncB( thermonuclease family)